MLIGGADMEIIWDRCCLLATGCAVFIGLDLISQNAVASLSYYTNLSQSVLCPAVLTLSFRKAASAKSAPLSADVATNPSSSIRKDVSACHYRFLYVFVLGAIGLPCLIAVMSEVCSR